MATDTAVQASQLPNPGASSLGGVQSKDCSGTGHVQRINSDGTVTCSADSGGGSSGWVSAPATVHSQATGTVNNDVTETVTGCAGGTPYYASCQGNACTPTTVTSYSTPILVAPDSSTKASFLSRCEVAHYDPSSVVRSDLTFQVGAITDSPGAGTYSSTQSVTLGGGSTSDYKCYTTDGTDPSGTAVSCTNGTHYTGAFNITSTSTLKAQGYKTNYAASAIRSAVYTISANTPAVVAGAFAAGLGANGGTTSPISTAGANAIVVAVSFDYGTRGTIAVSDSISSQNNGPPTAGNQTCTVSGSCSQLFWWTNPAHVGAGHTFTVTGTASYSAIAVLPLSGMVTSSLLDTQGAGTAGSAPCAAGSLNPSAGNKVVVTALATNATGQSITSPTGYNAPAGLQFAQTAAAYGLNVAYLIQTPNGSATNPSWSWTSSSAECSDAAFRGQ
jgi:Fn3 associated